MTVLDIDKAVTHVAGQPVTGILVHTIPALAAEDDFEILFYEYASAVKVPTQTAGPAYTYLGVYSQAGHSVHFFTRRLLAADLGQSVSIRWNDNTSGGAISTIKALEGYVLLRNTLDNFEIDIFPTPIQYAIGATKTTPTGVVETGGAVEIAIGTQTTNTTAPSATPWTGPAGFNYVSGFNTGTTSLNAMVIGTKMAGANIGDIGGGRALVAPQTAVGSAYTIMINDATPAGTVLNYALNDRIGIADTGDLVNYLWLEIIVNVLGITDTEQIELLLASGPVSSNDPYYEAQRASVLKQLGMTALQGAPFSLPDLLRIQKEAPAKYVRDILRRYDMD